MTDFSRPTGAGTAGNVSFSGAHGPDGPTPHQAHMTHLANQAAAAGLPGDARSIVENFLAPLGLGNLADWAWGVVVHSGDVQLGLQEVQAQLPQQAAFKARFPVYDQLSKQGQAVTVADILNYEKTARSLFQQAGLPTNFYDTPQELQSFMGHNVSASELQQRVQLAANAAQLTAEQNQALQGFMGATGPLSKGDLTAYWLNPDKALPLLQEKFTAAGVSGAAATAGFGQLSEAEATRLVREGFTPDQAGSQFGALEQAASAFNPLTSEQTSGIDRSTQLQAVEGNAFARERIARRQQQLAAAFQGEAGYGTSQRGVVGLGSSGG